MTRSGAITAIDTRLSTISDPAFVAVYRGEPLGISGTPVLAFWIEGRSSTALTLSNAGSTTTFTVRSYFRLQSSADMREEVEEDLWDAMYAVDNALRADSNLNDNVSDIRIGDASAGYVVLGGATFRTASTPLEVDILEDVTITP